MYQHLFILGGIGLTVLAKSALMVPVRMKARLFHMQCVGKSCHFLHIVYASGTRLLLCTTYAGAQDSKTLWYAICRKVPRIGSLVCKVYESSSGSRLFAMYYVGRRPGK